jgi:type IV pilus assembly protein PilA
MRASGNGFTLLEMVIIVAIIAILATIAVPSYLGSIARDQIVESMKLLEPLEEKIELLHRETGTLPADNQEADIPEKDKLIGNYITSIEFRDGAFHLLFGNKAVGALEGKVISVRAITVKDSPASPMSWLCANSGVPPGMQANGENRTNIKEGFLPMNCKDLAGKKN